MESNKKVIKASRLKSEDIHVETLQLGERRFHHKVFKDTTPEGKVEMSGINPGEEFKAHPHGHDKGDVQVEKNYDDDGTLKSIRLTCKCGEVIELDFEQE